MKYKRGDRVRIKSLDWYNENKDDYGEIPCSGDTFVKAMRTYCGTILTIIDKKEDYYFVEENEFSWVDEMIEGLAEEETLIERVDDNGLPFNEWLSHKGSFHVPDGYELKDENGNVINATKIVLEKKKNKYPKTYEECAEIIAEFTGSECNPKGCMGYMSVQLTALQRLLVCRDAYWKIAGEEMELGKDLPWVPDWMCLDPIYVILYQYHAIYKAEVNGGTSCILAFPTAEMRDAFYENFKDLIENCKELL